MFTELLYRALDDASDTRLELEFLAGVETIWNGGKIDGFLK